jgi:hypothetical protein
MQFKPSLISSGTSSLGTQPMIFGPADIVSVTEHRNGKGNPLRGWIVQDSFCDFGFGAAHCASGCVVATSGGNPQK